MEESCGAFHVAQSVPRIAVGVGREAELELQWTGTAKGLSKEGAFWKRIAPARTSYETSCGFNISSSVPTYIIL